MKKVNILSLALMLTLLVGFNSCKKDDDSAYQLKGNYGNADVLSKTFTGLQWVYAGSSEYDLTINDSRITQDVVDNGTVYCYMTTDNGASWVAIPMSISGVDIVYSYSLGRVDIGALGGSSAPSATTWKVVVLKSKAYSNMNIDWTNYNEVKSKLKLD